VQTSEEKRETCPKGGESPMQQPGTMHK